MAHLRPLGQHLLHDVLELVGDRVLISLGRDGVVLPDLGDGLHQGLALERGPAGEDGVERRPQAVDVGADVDLRVGAGPLGGHVGHVTGEFARAGRGPGLRRVAHPGQHQVAELGDLVLGADQDARRGDVVMDDVLLVQGLQCPGQLRAHGQRVPPVDHLARARDARSP